MPETDTRTVYARIDAAREHFPAVVKTKTGQVQNRTYQYADINAIVEAVEEPLRCEGVGIFPYTRDGVVGTELRLLREQEAAVNRVVHEIALPTDLTPQQVGSAITYFRRYTLQLALNLVAEDDDGHAASQPARSRTSDAARQGVVADDPAVPEGWESFEQATAAHDDLTQRVRELPDVQAQGIIAYRDERGWRAPYTKTQYDELIAQVQIAEVFHGDE